MTSPTQTDISLGYLADRLMIEDTLVAYATAHDTTQADRYPELFTEDAEICIPSGAVLAKGIDKIVAKARTDRERFNPAAKPETITYGSMRHVITNLDVTIREGKAKVNSYILTLGFDPTAKRPEIVSFGRYEDEMVKQNGRWKISKRTMFYDWGNDAMARQMGLGPYTPAEYRAS